MTGCDWPTFQAKKYFILTKKSVIHARKMRTGIVNPTDPFANIPCAQRENNNNKNKSFSEHSTAEIELEFFRNTQMQTTFQLRFQETQNRKTKIKKQNTFEHRNTAKLFKTWVPPHTLVFHVWSVCEMCIQSFDPIRKKTVVQVYRSLTGILGYSTLGYKTKFQTLFFRKKLRCAFVTPKVTSLERCRWKSARASLSNVTYRKYTRN